MQSYFRFARWTAPLIALVLSFGCQSEPSTNAPIPVAETPPDTVEGHEHEHAHEHHDHGDNHEGHNH
jgi:hypothetical protein